MAGRGAATVAGAGALGLSCALALAREGFEVVVCDPAAPFANASGVAAGMLAPVFEAVFDEAARPHFALLLAARDLWPALAAETGVALERSGALAAGGRDWIAQVAGGVAKLGLHPVEIPNAAAMALAPGLSDAAQAVLLNREDWRLDPPQALSALRAACEAAGVRFRAEVARGREGDLMVVATGADRQLETFAPELAQLSPIKGQVLRSPLKDQVHVSVRGEDAYVVPNAAGLSVGATMEPGLADRTPDPAAAAGFRTAAERLFPALRSGGGELVAGVRAATPDGLPLVGFSAAPGVLLAVGARRNGWLLAPLVARLVANLASGRDAGPYAARLDPRRFG